MIPIANDIMTNIVEHGILTTYNFEEANIMWGQWIGSFGETANPAASRKSAFLNIDRDTPERGKLAIYSLAQPTKGLWCDVIIDANNPHNAYLLIPPFQDRKEILHGEMVFGDEVDGVVSGTWATNNESKGDFELQLSNDTSPTPPDRKFQKWASFKKWVSSHKSGTLIYRGQSNNRWRLKTSFHRTDRFDLLRYGGDEVQQLNHYITGILERSFDINSPLELIVPPCSVYILGHPCPKTPALGGSHACGGPDRPASATASHCAGHQGYHNAATPLIGWPCVLSTPGLAPRLRQNSRPLRLSGGCQPALAYASLSLAGVTAPY